MRPRNALLHDPSRGVCSSNALVFMHFRTLSRNGALPTPFSSITSAFFPVQRRGCQHSFPASTQNACADSSSSPLRSTVNCQLSTVLPFLYSQQLPTIKLNYPMRIVHPERSEGSLRRWVMTLTRPCVSLYFQQLPIIHFSNLFVLITIQIAGGRGPQTCRSESITRAASQG